MPQLNSIAVLKKQKQKAKAKPKEKHPFFCQRRQLFDRSHTICITSVKLFFFFFYFYRNLNRKKPEINLVAKHFMCALN